MKLWNFSVKWEKSNFATRNWKSRKSFIVPIIFFRSKALLHKQSGSGRIGLLFEEDYYIINNVGVAPQSPTVSVRDESEPSLSPSEEAEEGLAGFQSLLRYTKDSLFNPKKND